jgi:hypothetical protein
MLNDFWRTYWPRLNVPLQFNKPRGTLNFFLCSDTCSSKTNEVLAKARFRRCTFHVPNLIDEFGRRATRCVRNRLVASLSTSCNNAVILSSCYKVVTHNVLTNTLFFYSLQVVGTTCNESVQLNNLVASYQQAGWQLVNKLGTSSANTSCWQVVGTALLYKSATTCAFLRACVRQNLERSKVRHKFRRACRMMRRWIDID